MWRSKKGGYYERSGWLSEDIQHGFRMLVRHAQQRARYRRNAAALLLPVAQGRRLDPQKPRELRLGKPELFAHRLRWND